MGKKRQRQNKEKRLRKRQTTKETVICNRCGDRIKSTNIEEHVKNKCKGWHIVVGPDKIFVRSKGYVLRLEIRNLTIDEDKIIDMINNSEPIIIDANTGRLFEEKREMTDKEKESLYKGEEEEEYPDEIEEEGIINVTEHSDKSVSSADES